MEQHNLGMMHLATFVMRSLVGIFLLGMAGSAVVVLISFVEDFRELLSHD
jgi:hypothetical protein